MMIKIINMSIPLKFTAEVTIKHHVFLGGGGGHVCGGPLLKLFTESFLSLRGMFS